MYVEKSLPALHLQMGNFLTKLDANVIDKFGLDKKKIAQSTADWQYIGWSIEAKTAYSSYSKSWTKFGEHLVLDADNGVAVITPTLPVLPAMPAPVPPGIRARFISLAEDIANNSLCTNDILVNLGIAPVQAPVNTQLQPEPKLKTEAGHPLISYKKRNQEGAQIYKDSSDGKGFVRFDKATTSKYIDESPLPPSGTAVVWTYKLIFIKGNKEIGNFSNPVSISVVGI